MVDDQKWSSAIAYVRAYNDWKAALAEHGDAFHPKVTEMWDALQIRVKEYRRMAKK